MEEKLRGIVLNAVSFGENDKMLSVYTLEKGLVSSGIKGVKKAGAKLKFAAEPFCFAEFIFSVSGERRTVIGASLIDSFYPLREDIKKFYAGSAVLEFIKKFCREEMISSEMFILAAESLKDIAYGNGGTRASAVKFFTRALSIAGFGLNLNGCANCGEEITGKTYFDCASGAFYCENCFSGSGREINNSTLLALKAAAERGEELPETLGALKLLEYYIEYRADENVKSLSELIRL